MGRSRLLLAILFLFLSYGMIWAEDLVCSSEEHFEDGGSMGADVKLKMQNDRIATIEFNTFVASGKEGGAYFCTFNASNSDHKSVWTYTKQRVEVRILADKEGPDEESTFEIAATPKGYVISFTKMSRYYCGFGAEFPNSLTITKGNSACSVDYAY
jgi:hypothetical protein